MNTKVTMKDIAEKLGVSSVTISKALNDKDGVSEELKEKIKRVADEMGYRYNTMAKSMKEGLSYNIGVIVSERFIGDDVQSFYLNFFSKISKCLESFNYYGILHNLSYEDEKNLILPRIYNENRVDGIIILGQLKSDYIDLLKNIDIPIVFLDFYDSHMEVDTIITDNYYGAYEITNYLINNGHKKIAFVGNIYSTSSIQDRFLGYCKALLENRIELDFNYFVNDRNEDGKYIDFQLPKDLPTAFVCNNDQVAYHLINFLQKSGFHIPEDFSVVGFDNDIYAQISNPKLTTVEVDMDTMARTATKILVDRIKKSRKSVNRIQVPGKIIVRDSVKDISTDEKEEVKELLV